MDKLIMTFQIYVDDALVSDMNSPYGCVSFIPFTGEVRSELFV